MVLFLSCLIRCVDCTAMCPLKCSFMHIIWNLVSFFQIKVLNHSDAHAHDAQTRIKIYFFQHQFLPFLSVEQITAIVNG